eukprot:TRINITY_DN10913_c0_g1_i1.p1 TRINITY_DN10913_c0_g1~~TRINITY_DN10913_c0_g1_i1.p1  ORF type:complete len:557 (+),score=150.32 TRINITY_DN10913_c0_g1_i1:57-1673(+)
MAAMRVCAVLGLAAWCAALSEVDLEGGEWTEYTNLPYTVTIAEKKAGLMGLRFSKRETEDGGVVYKVEEHLKAKIARGPDSVELAFRNIIIENADGDVLLAGYTQKMATQEVQMQYNYISTPGSVDITSVSNGVALPSKVEGAVAHGRKYLFDRLGKLFEKDGPKDASMTVHAVKPEMGPADRRQEATLKASGQRYLPGLSVSADDLLDVYDITVEVEGMPLVISESYHYHPHTSPMPLLVEYEVDSPMGRIVASISTQDAAQAALDNDDARPELVVASYVKLPRPMHKLWMTSGRVEFLVSSKNGERLDLPNEGYQQVERVREGVVKAVLDTGAPEEDTMEEEEVARLYLSNSAMVDASDEEILKLRNKAIKAAKKAHNGSPTPEQLAHAARALTRETITTSNLATGFASASETARTKSGDCSEHAVLLAAILRALRLPSRTCSGLVYLEDRNGPNLAWHMWAQVLLPGPGGKQYWHDLDATFRNGQTYSLGHVLFGTSSMSDAEAHMSEIRIVSMIGNLNVEVLEVGEATCSADQS